MCGLHGRPKGYVGECFGEDPPCYLAEKVAQAEAKHSLENYCFTTHNILQEVFGGGSIAQHEALQETLDWLDKNPRAEIDEFNAQQKELAGAMTRIMMQAFQAAGTGSPTGEEAA